MIARIAAAQKAEGYPTFTEFVDAMVHAPPVASPDSLRVLRRGRSAKVNPGVAGAITSPPLCVETDSPNDLKTVIAREPRLTSFGITDPSFSDG